jgi:hypothetical protein
VARLLSEILRLVIQSGPQQLKPPAQTALMARLKSCPSPSDLRLHLATQFAHDCGDVIVLEESDGGDAGRAGAQAALGILQSHAS